mmetsp:Transcript_7376/g.20504  ORF Transcript_7376/g.20504 Transcript_7376/m.20504 type:complete len:357 (+) Transcript_7376:622-1692(+)
MTASAPSYNAVATSLHSALVGVGDSIIDSSICVATTTGTPFDRHRFMMVFWTTGTSSGFISTPRSPRATIIPSHNSTILSISWTACGFSIFAISRTKGRSEFLTMVLNSSMSSGRCTKLRATQSMFCVRAKARSARSFGVRGEIGMVIEGVLTPFLSDIVPPTITSQSTPSLSLLVTCSRNLPSSTNKMSSSFKVWRISGCGSLTLDASPGSSTSSNLKDWPCTNIALPLSKTPTLSLGPCKSANMPIGWPCVFSNCLIFSMSSRFSSWLPWLKLSLKTSTPAAKSFSSISLVLEAGPTVASCLVDLRQRAGVLSGSEAVKATTCGASSSTMLMLLLYRCLWPAAARNANAAAPGA